MYLYVCIIDYDGRMCQNTRLLLANVWSGHHRPPKEELNGIASLEKKNCRMALQRDPMEY